MAGLKKPLACACGSVKMTRRFSPERWECLECAALITSRAPKNTTRSCRVCKAERGTKPFSNHGNICTDCKSKYNAAYIEKNYDKLREQHKASYQRDKKKRQASVRNSIQRSPEAFIRSLHHRLVKKSNARAVECGKLNRMCLSPQVDYNYLISLWKKQSGLCAISGIPMKHEFNKLDAISIDRIDSSKGYVDGNVQLVCQGMNTFKRHFDMAEVNRVLDIYYITRRKLEDANDDIFDDAEYDDSEVEQIETPWGISDNVYQFGNGIVQVTTPRHGGIYVPNELLHKIPAVMRIWAASFSGSENWYEEDCCWAAVCFGFPEFFVGEQIESSKEILARFQHELNIDKALYGPEEE